VVLSSEEEAAYGKHRKRGSKDILEGACYAPCTVLISLIFCVSLFLMPAASISAIPNSAFSVYFDAFGIYLDHP
jgi:hypothetical protein